MVDLTKRFSVGIDVDDSWRYAGAREPKSIIIPHLLSIDLPVGRVIDRIDEFRLRKHHHTSLGAATCSLCRGAILSLSERLYKSHVKFVRSWFPWRLFESTLIPQAEMERLISEPYADFPMDAFVEMLVDHGIGVIPVLGCGYQRMLPDGVRVDSDRELYLNRICLHAKLLVRKYRSKVRFWQIENEPNWWPMHVAGGWRKGFSWVHSHDFKFRLLNALNQTVHDEAPNAKTIINLEADARKLGASSYAPYCDLIGLDFYPNYKASSPIDTSVFRKAREVGRECEKPVIISETGYPSGPSFLGYNPSKQAEYAEKALAEAYSIEEITAVGFWRYRDSAWRSFPFQENHFGLIDFRGNPKPAWWIITARRLA